MAILRQVVLFCACISRLVVLSKPNAPSFIFSVICTKRNQVSVPTKRLPPVLLTCQAPCGKLPTCAKESASTGFE